MPRTKSERSRIANAGVETEERVRAEVEWQMTCRSGDEKPPVRNGREERAVGGGRKEQSKVPSTLACYRVGACQRIGSSTRMDAPKTAAWQLTSARTCLIGFRDGS